jgi:hypothetical protein
MLHIPNRIYLANLNNIRLEASKHFKIKKKEYLKDKINELAKTVRTRILETCIESQLNLRAAVDPEVI